MTLKNKIYTIVFESDTKAGRAFDLVLLFLIFFSVLIVALESVAPIHEKLGKVFSIIEWIITLLFSIEYILRVSVVKRPLRYIISFYGIIDLLSILPLYLGFFIAGTHQLVTIRALRLLRVFRILKLNQLVKEGNILISALKSSRNKIGVFLFAVMNVVIIIGTVMYLVEGEENGFTNIPVSLYWAIVTLTTVGYGDISPVTPLGQFLASLVMIMGYAIIAVPTGIVTVELSKKSKEKSGQVCQECMKEGHDNDADYCKYCGAKIDKK